MNIAINILLYALLPAGSLILGSIFSAFRPPGPIFRSHIQHFAAGVVFSVVGVELLPDIIKGHAPVQVVIGFAIGVILMLAIRGFTEKYESAEDEQNDSKSSTGLLVAVAVDIFIDGILIGIGFAAGAKEGKLLTLALTVELLSLGLAVTSTLIKSGKTKANTIKINSMLAISIVIGAALGATLLQNLSPHMLEIVLSFGLAALLFLVTEELLVEAHEEPETLMATASFFGGFLLFLILGMVG